RRGRRGRHRHGGGRLGRLGSRPGARQRDGKRGREGEVARRSGERGPLPPRPGRQGAAAAHHARAALRARSRTRARATHRSGPAGSQGGRGLISGVALVVKSGGPAGPTSHDVVDTVRRALGTDRVGHLGTLDPCAAGLLVIVVGRATRLAPFAAAWTKAYEGVRRPGP